MTSKCLMIFYLSCPWLSALRITNAQDCNGLVKLMLLCHLICILLAATLKPLCLHQAEGLSSLRCVWKLAFEEWERRQQAGTGLLTPSAAARTLMRRLPAMPVTTARCTKFAAAAQKHALPSVHPNSYSLLSQKGLAVLPVNYQDAATRASLLRLRVEQRL